MMKLLPTAARIGFTGTPLLSSDNITARTFGGYVSVYDFKRAVEDGATVPLYYENRGEKIVDLHNPEITNQILDAIENADLDVDQQDKLEAEFAKEIHLLTAEPRLRSIARDFVSHYSDLWTSGKAMFVCLNKVTCVRMYNYVQEYWKDDNIVIWIDRLCIWFIELLNQRKDETWISFQFTHKVITAGGNKLRSLCLSKKSTVLEGITNLCV